MQSLYYGQVTELAEDFAAMPKGGSDRKRAKLACGKPLPTASSATFGPLAEVCVGMDYSYRCFSVCVGGF